MECEKGLSVYVKPMSVEFGPCWPSLPQVCSCKQLRIRVSVQTNYLLHNLKGERIANISYVSGQ